MTQLTRQGFPHSANPEPDWKVAFARKEIGRARRLRYSAAWRSASFLALAVLAGAALNQCFLAQAQEAQKNVISYLDEQPVRAKHGMVVSVHHLASDAGLEVLREGGNAVDAAVATGFALAVVHPAAGNLGGGGFMLIRIHDGNDIFLDYREKAPLAATETMYQDAHGNVLPEESLEGSVIGYKSIGTPGSVAGMVHAEKKYGKLGLQRVVAPAIKLAAEGFVLSAEEAKELTDPTWRSFPTPGASSSATETCIRKAKPSSSRSWRGRCNASRPIPTHFTTGQLPMS